MLKNSSDFGAFMMIVIGIWRELKAFFNKAFWSFL